MSSANRSISRVSTSCAQWIEELEDRQLLSVAPLKFPKPSTHQARPSQHAADHARHVRALLRAATARAQATISTDRADYRPGQNALITGAGFRALERVRLQVLHIDGTPNTAPEHQPWIVTAGADGSIATSYPVGQDDLNTTMELTAVGLSSGRIATKTFTDAGTLTQTAITSSTATSAFGQAVTFTATVTGGAKSTGNITFNDGATVLGTAALNSSGVAMLTTSSLAAGDHSVTASYPGDTTHAASASAAITQTVNAAQTTTSVSSSTGGGSSNGPFLRPDHIVVVIEEDRAVNAIGDTAHMPYFNQLASTGLVYSNSHGINTPAQQGEMDYLGLYSGSSQGVTDNGRGYSFSTANLAKLLNSTPGLSFAGFSESLPSNGSQVQQAADPVSDPANHPDLYVRNYNPMAMFTDAGPGKVNADVNKTFASFPSDFSTLPTVSFVVPNTLHSTHGSNEAPPYATDPTQYNFLRTSADTWLKQKLDGYLQWAKAHNSLLIVTTDEEDRQHPGTLTTIVNGDAHLFVAGTDATSVNHYNTLRTIEDMVGVGALGNSASVSAFAHNAQGQLAPPGASSGSAVYGQPVTFTATVAAQSPGAGAPTGTVQFQVDGANVGSPVTVANGLATSAPISSLSVASHSVTAIFTGSSANYAASNSSAYSQTVAKDSTAATVTSSANPSTAGQSVTLTATISARPPGSGVPTGPVTFMDGTTAIGSAVLNSSGQAALTTSSLASGSHSITVVYAGDPNFIGTTSSAINQTVNAAQTATSTSTTVSSSATPSSFGQSITFTASVTPASGSTTPTGTIQFTLDGANFGAPVAMVNGSATSAAINSLSVGTHSFSAVYSGSASFSSSASATLSQSVNPAATTTSISSSANPATAGQSITFTATVLASAPGAGTPGGTVQFVIDGANFGAPVALVNGSATSTATSTLTAGSHTITAIYSGASSFTGSTSAALTQTIQTANVSNDLFANRATLTGSAATATASSSTATKETGEPNHAGAAGGKSLWWTWTAPSTGSCIIDTLGSSFDTLLAVYTGSSVSALTAVASNDDSPAGGTTTSKVTFNAVAGTVYQIAVDGYGGVGGSVTLHLNLGAPAPTTNDLFANRTVITGAAATLTGSNVGATKETGEPNHGGNVGGKSVWYTWTAPTSGTVTIDTLGSSFDTLLSAYTGSSVSALTSVASNDDSSAGGTTTSKISFAVTAGTTYQIAVDGYAGASGNITLHLNLV